MNTNSIKPGSGESGEMFSMVRGWNSTIFSKRDRWRKGPLIVVNSNVGGFIHAYRIRLSRLRLFKKKKNLLYSRQRELPLSRGVSNCQLERIANWALSPKLVQAKEGSWLHTGQAGSWFRLPGLRSWFFQSVPTLEESLAVLDLLKSSYVCFLTLPGKLVCISLTLVPICKRRR